MSAHKETTSDTTATANSGCLKRLVRPWYVGDVIDTRVKTGWRGKVKCLNKGKLETVAIVYGETLEKMRKRKHAFAAMLNGELANNRI